MLYQKRPFSIPDLILVLVHLVYSVLVLPFTPILLIFTNPPYLHQSSLSSPVPHTIQTLIFAVLNFHRLRIFALFMFLFSQFPIIILKYGLRLYVYQHVCPTYVCESFEALMSYAQSQTSSMKAMSPFAPL